MTAFIHTLLRYALAFVILSMGASSSVVAQTILDHSAVTSDSPSVPRHLYPQSVFHAWETADAEAQKIIESWKNEQVTIPWTRVQLDRHVKHKIMPTRAARGLALMHVAMHDAYIIATEKKISPKLAVSMAAAQVLGYLFNAEERAFDRIAYSVAARLEQTRPESLSAVSLQALELGFEIGQNVVRHGDTDGAQKGWNGIRLQWYGEGRYYGPGAWEPTPPYFYYPPDEPFAPNWRPWALANALEFLPVPPEYGSPKYIQDLQEVVEINKNLRPEQLRIAKFWVDGHGTMTPPGHWNQIAMAALAKARFDDMAVARLFAHLNMAEADAFIASWAVKYHYWTARPITAAKLLLGVTFTPAVLTPPFPSYVSGHAVFSGAAAHILGAYFPAQSEKLNAMAAEAAESRLLGGIHFRHDNDDGLQLGRNVAAKVLSRFGGGR